jgi:hypothetical protein
MTLPQETLEAIEKDASVKTKAKEAEIKDRFYKHSPNKIAYLDGYETGRIEGATEWAGKAQDLADTLKWIQMHAPIEPVVDDAISAAIAKYKEVSNG